MPAVRWPWPATSATRPGRCWPCRPQPSPPRPPTIWTAPWARRQAGADHWRRARLDSAVQRPLTEVLIMAGDLAAAEQVCAAGWPASRDAGDVMIQPGLLSRMGPGPRPAAPRTPRRTCVKRSRSPCGPASGRAVNAWTAAGTCAPRPGGRPRPSRCGPRSPRSCGEDGLAGRCAAAAEPCAQPAGARARPERRPRTRRGDEHGHRGRVRPDADHPARSSRGAPGRGTQRPGTRAGHPGRPGPPMPRSPRSCTSACDRPLHLDRIRDKTGCRRRADLTRLALSEGLV